MATSNAAPAMSSLEFEAFLDSAVQQQQQQQQQQRQKTHPSSTENNSDSYYADFEEDGSEAMLTEESAGNSKSWLGSLWDLLVSLYVPFMIQFIFGASFYIIRTLLLGYALHYTVQFFTAAGEKLPVQWLGLSSSSGKNTPLPALIGLAVLTIVALIVHPDGYTWIILRKIRCVAGKRKMRFVCFAFFLFVCVGNRKSYCSGSWRRPG